MAAASKPELNRFVQVVDKFLQRYETLNNPATRERVYATNDRGLIGDYETTLSRSKILKITIEKTVGVWKSAKAAWGGITDTASTYIGDAVDEIRSWFGYRPAGGLDGRFNDLGALSALGAIQIPAAAWVAGIIATALILTKAIDEVLVRVEASRIQHETGVPREQALAKAKDIYSKSLLGDIIDWKVLAVIALATYFIVSR